MTLGDPAAAAVAHPARAMARGAALHPRFLARWLPTSFWRRQLWSSGAPRPPLRPLCYPEIVGPALPSACLARSPLAPPTAAPLLHLFQLADRADAVRLLPRALPHGSLALHLRPSSNQAPAPGSVLLHGPRSSLRAAACHLLLPSHRPPRGRPRMRGARWARRRPARARTRRAHSRPAAARAGSGAPCAPRARRGSRLARALPPFSGPAHPARARRSRGSPRPHRRAPPAPHPARG